MGLKTTMMTAAASLLLAGGVLAGAQPACAVDLAVYGRLPQVEDMALSPSGRYVAMIVTDGEKRRVAVQDAVAKKIVYAVDAGDSKVRQILFADDDNVIVLVSRLAASNGMVQAEMSEYTGGMLVNVKTKQVRQLLADRKSGGANDMGVNMVLATPQPRTFGGQTHIYVTGIAFPPDGGTSVRALYDVSLTNGRTDAKYQGSESMEFLVDGEGNLAAQRLTGGRLQVRIGGKLQAVKAVEDIKGGFYIVGFAGDGKTVLIGYGDENAPKLAKISDDLQLTAIDVDNDVVDPIRGKAGIAIGALARQGDRLVYRFDDPADQKKWNAIAKAYAGQIVTFEQISDDHKVWLLRADSPTEGPAWYRVDMATGQADSMGQEYRGLKPTDVSPVEAVSYNAADGLLITGYLTLPRAAGDKPKNLPLVVLPHGGPAARDSFGFDWWSQALAAQGYAVLRPNFRGSGELGETFKAAGYGQWGRKMQTDLSDGVRYLAKEGTIDPKRVCIVGASYGGYAALAGATIDKGVYRCAASVAGPGDLKKFLASASPRTGSLQYWARYMGVEGRNDPDLSAINPAAHAGEVTIPLLLIHGKDDVVVEYAQSQAMADAMRKAGKPVEFVTLEGEDHWLSRGVTRQQMLTAVSDFLAKNNPVN